jgi:predicted heme/steroid binding protein
MRTSASVRSVIVIIGIMILAVLVVAGCGGKSENATKTQGSSPQGSSEKVFTLQELSKYNGQNGQKAYVAVDGVVYDVTGSPNWPGGKHSPCNLEAVAGKDLSEILKQAPARMRVYISGKPVVGRLQGD